MSLEGDLSLAPRGPARWGWTQKMMTAIARARGVISPDDSVQVMPSTGALTLRRRGTQRAYGANEYNDLPYGYEGLNENGNPVSFPPDPFQLRSDNTVTGGWVRFDAPSPVDVYVEGISIPRTSTNKLVCVHVPLGLTVAGTALTPVHFNELSYPSEVELNGTMQLVMLTPSQFAAAQSYPIPGVAGAGNMYIPVAAIDEAGKRDQWWHGAFWMELHLYHDHFVVSTYG